MVSAKREPFLCFLTEGRILRGREGNNLLVYACGTNSLFLFSFISLFFFFFFVFTLIFSYFFLSFLLLVSIFWFSSS